jgi:hypothetical protein
MEMEKDKYLQEDKDLIDQLELSRESVKSYADDPNGAANANLAALQIKSTLRNRKTMIDLDKSNRNL